MKKLLLFLAFMAVSLCSIAQNQSHVIQRGETIESIARSYGVSTEELLRFNPDAKSFVYVGMKLVIPQKNITTNNTPIPSSISEEDLPNSNSQNTIDTNKNVVLGVFYSNSFKKHDKGIYGFSADNIGCFAERIGLSQTFQTNLFLEDFDYFSLSYAFGPNVSFPLTSNGNSQMIIPLMLNFNPYANGEGKVKFMFGMASTPKLVYYLTPKIGLQLGGMVVLPFVNNTKLSGAFMFGLVF